MNDRKETKRKLFNIFEKTKMCNSLNEISHSEVKTPKLNLKLTARSTRLKSEIFVERFPPGSLDNDPYDITKNDLEDKKLVYTPPKKKAKVSKSPSFMERIDKYFSIQPSEALNEQSPNDCLAALEVTEKRKQNMDKTENSSVLNEPNLKEDDNLQEYEDSFIDSIDTNAIIEMLNNTEIVDSQYQEHNENSNYIATQKNDDSNSNDNLKIIVSLNSKERKVSNKENNNLPKRKTRSDTFKENQNFVESSIDTIDTNAIIDMLNNSEIVEGKFQKPTENSNIISTSKRQHSRPKEIVIPIVSLNSKVRKVSSKETNKLKRKNRLKTSRETIDANAKIDMIDNREVVEGKSQEQNENSNYFTTPKKNYTIPTENRNTMENITSPCKESNDVKKKPRANILKNSRASKARFSAFQTEVDNSLDSINDDALSNISNTQTRTQESIKTKTPTSLTSSTQKTAGNEISVSLRKRVRRQTISSLQMDSNVTKVIETGDICQLPRKRERRLTICQTRVENQFTCEANKTVKSSLESTVAKAAKRIPKNVNKKYGNKNDMDKTGGRKPKISACQTENENSLDSINDDALNISNISNNQKKTQESVKPETTTSLTSSAQTTVGNEKAVSLRKRVRRQTIGSAQMDSNVTNVIETSDTCQLPKKRGRRLTICQTKLESYFTYEANKNYESSPENQTDVAKINTDVKLSKKITKNLNRKYDNSKQNGNIDAMTNNACNEPNTYPTKHNEKLQTGAQQVKNQSTKPKKITNTDKKANEGIAEPKRKRGRPRSLKSPQDAAEKQPKPRIKKINVAKKPKNTCGRLSKDKLNSANIRKIPKDRLDEVLDMLQNEDHEIWRDRNISCNAGIHRYWETRPMTSDQNMKMKYARQFLLRRDWLNLSKILCLSNQDAKNNIYYPLLVKYATLCLAHTDKEQFHKFVNSLITMADSSAIIKKCTNISQQNEE